MSNLTDYHLAFDRDLLLEFVLEFSRFEYALKRAGYVKRNQDDAKPDWPRFAIAIRGQLSATTAPAGAIEVLVSHPPKKQVVTSSGKLSWQLTSRGSGQSHEDYVLCLVRRIRNNLFHGGKFPDPIGPIHDQARDEKLLRASLTILRYCRALVPDVNAFFQEAA